MIRAAIFDMDGLLIDSEPLWRNAEVAVFSALGTPMTHVECLETMGLRIDEAVDYWRKKKGWSSEEPIHSIAERIVDDVIRQIRADARPKPGALETIDMLSARGTRICVASSSSMRIIREVVAALAIGTRLEFVHSAEHEEFGKPHPAVYLAALTKFGLPASDCIAFEDSARGVRAAVAAGIRCVGVPDEGVRPEQLREAGATPVLRSLTEFSLESL